MKNSILILSVAVTLLCGFLLARKNWEMAEIRARMAAADQARAADAAQIAQEEKRNKSLQKRLRQTMAEASGGAPVAEAKPAAVEHKGMSQMFRDAMMKEALQAEAKVAVTKTVQKLFDAGLASRLQLNDDQSAALRQLLTQRTSILWEQMLVPMTTGEVDEANMAATGQAIKQGIEQNAAQIRALVGEDGYNTCQWFEKTQPERDEANGFSAMTASEGQNLTPDQQSQLLDMMTAERANFNFQYDLGDPAKLDYQDWYGNFTEEKVNAYQQDMEQLNDRIAQQAQGVLTPDQSSQLNQFLQQRLFESMVTVRSTMVMMSGNAR